MILIIEEFKTINSLLGLPSMLMSHSFAMLKSPKTQNSKEQNDTMMWINAYRDIPLKR